MLARRHMILLAIAPLFCLNAMCPSTPSPNADGTPGMGTVEQLSGPRLLTTSDRDGLAAILTFKRDASLTGDAEPAMVLTGPSTDLKSPKGLAANNAGQLLVVTDEYNATRADFDVFINVYADTTRLNGDQAPIRQVRVTGLFNVIVNDVTFDSNSEILYIALGIRSTGGGAPILAFSKTDEGTFDGPLAPDFKFSQTNGEAFALFIDEKSGLLAGTKNGASYCQDIGSASATCSNILFGGTATGISLNSAGDIFALVRDGDDRRLRRAGAGFITAGGSDDDFELDIQIDNLIDNALTFPHELTIDTSGTAYISSSDRRMFIYENIFTRTEMGSVNPDRIVTGETAHLGSNLAGNGELLLLD